MKVGGEKLYLAIMALLHERETEVALADLKHTLSKEDISTANFSYVLYNMIVLGEIDWGAGIVRLTQKGKLVAQNLTHLALA